MAVEPSRKTVLRDEYVVLERIGTHAGEVFRARHVRDRRSLIVRIWRSDDTAARALWLERAQLASRVRHPVLPAIEAWGQHGEHAAYVVTEYADGERLDQYSDRVGIPPIPNVIELFRHLCIGLNAAHRNGLAHDALHPRNILVTEVQSDGLVRLAPRVIDLAVPAFMYRFPPYLQAAQFMAPERLAAVLSRDRARCPPPTCAPTCTPAARCCIACARAARRSRAARSRNWRARRRSADCCPPRASTRKFLRRSTPSSCARCRSSPLSAMPAWRNSRSRSSA